MCVCASQVKFTSAVKLSEGGAAGPEYGRDEEENFFKRLGKWRSGRRNPSKLHHTEEKDGRPPPPQGAPLAHPPLHRLLSISLPLCCFVALSRPSQCSRGLLVLPSPESFLLHCVSLDVSFSTHRNVSLQKYLTLNNNPEVALQSKTMQHMSEETTEKSLFL